MEIKTENLEVAIVDESSVLYARHLIRRFSSNLGFTDFETDKIELIISELGMNIVKYAVKGTITAKKIDFLSFSGIEIISEDKGKGIKDLLEYLHKKPQPNLKGSLKAGLSAIYNLSDEFEYHHDEEDGTKLIARKWLPYSSALKFSVISRPKPEEYHNGDAFYIKQLPEYSFFCIIDGLGHGEEAAVAANAALDCIKIYYYYPLDKMLLKCHDYLNSTRGAVISACKIYNNENRMEYIGMGNVEMRIIGSPETPRIFNCNGTVGLNMEPFQIQSCKHYFGSTYIMYSDGIKEFVLDADTIRLSPQKIAGFLMDNYSRAADDATVLVAR